MLTLRRKQGECIIINAPDSYEDIAIKVVELTPTYTRIGIEALPIYTIAREELVMSLYEIRQTTGLSLEESQRYKEILNHFQRRTQCSNIELRYHHQSILDYLQRYPSSSITAAACLYLERAYQGLLIPR